jgi:hypothetical protein
MRSLSTATFCKHRTCPSSQALLRYHHATLSREAIQSVSTHLSSCDFCDAELSLLSKFPPKGAPASQPPRMPWHLYRLAKGLLTLSTGDIARTVEAIYETGNLTLTDA